MKKETTKEYELKYCEIHCGQLFQRVLAPLNAQHAMTNHIGDICQKCKLPAKDSTIEGVIETIMNSDPMKRVLSLEQSSIITGRAPQYKGVTIQEVIRSALTAQKEEIGREIVEKFKKEYEEMMETLKGETPFFDMGIAFLSKREVYKKTLEEDLILLESIVSSITSNKEKK